MDRLDLVPELAAYLKRDYDFKEVTTGGVTYLRGGTCPDCKKKELWTWADKPFHLQCSRLSKCGWESSAKALYPELFDGFSKRYPPTPADPLATAKAYLRYHRGLDPDRMAGWFTQHNFWRASGDRGTNTVRFPLAEGVYWEKLIETVTLTKEDGTQEVRSENFAGRNKGLWWMPPEMTIEDGDTVYWAEGIFDCIALYFSGRKAVSIMACANFPEHSIEPHQDKAVTWVLALDNDAAGRKWSLRHVERLRALGLQTGCVLPGEGEEKIDWNDLAKADRLTESHWREYQYFGALLIADTRDEKALTIYRHRELSRFVFDFRARTFAFQLNLDDFTKHYEAARNGQTEQAFNTEAACREYALSQSKTIMEIATFGMEFRYFERPETGEEGRYFFRFAFPNGAEAQNIALPGRVFGSAGDFKKAVLNLAPGALWTGNSGHLDMLYKQWFGRKHKVITTIDYIGYDRDAGAYLFHDFAVKAGKSIARNADDYFDLGGAGMKSTSTIALSLSQEVNLDWVDDFRTAYGERGLVALTFWFGSLFAEQIRDDYRSYPFLEIYGEPGSGKSYLLEFLWKLCGRDGYEGFDPNKSTAIGRSRAMTQVANLPVVLIEADRSEEGPHSRRFDWEELKTLYDGEIGRVTGVKNQGNDIKFPPFRGSLVIAQNAPVAASDAIMSRIIQVYFDRSGHTEAGRAASDRLNRLPVEAVSGFVRHCILHEIKILERFRGLAKGYEDQLIQTGKVKMVRVAKNHGHLMALAKCLPMVLPIDDAAADRLCAYIASLAAQRQQAMNSDPPLIQRFWDAFHYLDRTSELVAGELVEIPHRANHSPTPEREIAINLEHFQSACASAHLEPFSNRELRELLPSSKRYPFIENRPQRSKITGTTLRCWVFQRPGAGARR